MLNRGHTQDQPQSSRYSLNSNLPDQGSERDRFVVLMSTFRRTKITPVGSITQLDAVECLDTTLESLAPVRI